MGRGVLWECVGAPRFRSLWAWVWLGRLRSGVGRFCLSTCKWGLAPSANCECGAPETEGPTHRAPRGMFGLTLLDDETRCWLKSLNRQHLTQAAWRPGVVKSRDPRPWACPSCHGRSVGSYDDDIKNRFSVRIKPQKNYQHPNFQVCILLGMCVFFFFYAQKLYFLPKIGLFAQKAVSEKQ